MNKYLLLIAVSSFACAGSASAQDRSVEPGAGEDALEELFGPAPEQREVVLDEAGEEPAEITVTANGLPTNIRNTGQSVTLIGRDEIEAVQGADVQRVLQRAPGVTFTRNGPVGAVGGIAVRGAGADELLVLIDGVRVADSASPSGGFDAGGLLTGNTGKYDLLRGANSTIWGADAVAGVLDISTRAQTGLTASAEYGSRETLFANAAGGIGGENYYAGLSASFYDSDGFSAAAVGNEADGFEQLALTGSGFVDVTDALELFVSGRYADSTLEYDGFPAPTFVLGDTADIQDTVQYSGAVGANYYAQDLTLRVSYSLADTERENFAAPARDAVGFASDGESERLSLRAEYRLIGGLTLAYGGEHEATRYATSFAGFEDGASETSITGGYAQAGWSMRGLSAHLGVRYDDHEDFGGQTSFGGDVSYALGGDWRVRASFGEGFKPPSLFQLYSDYGNRTLEAEESTSYDAGVEYGTRGADRHFALTAFRRDSDNLIDFVGCAVPTGICTDRPFGTYDNIGEARAQGIEVEAGFRLMDAIRVGSQYTFINSENRSTGDPNEGNRLARRPRHSGTLYADWTGPAGLTLGTDLRIVGASFDDAGNAVRLDSYALLDLRAELALSERIALFGRVENLWDEDYQTAGGYANAGRGVFAGLRAGL
ncbi:TonB-dependent receptor plug domain-containing protein [Qipengyuania atrilutea]|uniref:TonB-dependent receptor n=1 Tax=Qipengyuania atrilutea TaxID=2744473 RepID=A0A850H0M0_9SPHN|nr:TonB-dependent receptor [Actirhodobacter atriluteus]NVD44070.1 TonB-dependent receptor [Actirhodobacter atriluteus]